MPNEKMLEPGASRRIQALGFVALEQSQTFDTRVTANVNVSMSRQIRHLASWV
jgi:hypothetical protein